LKSRYPKTRKCETCNLAYDLAAVAHRYTLLAQELIGAKDGGNYNKSNKDYHAFIPSAYVLDTIRGLEEIRAYLISKRRNSKWWRPKFLDCGCGIGNIMYLAHTVNYEPTGIEYEAFVYKAAKKFLKGLSWCKLIRGDILNYGSYHKYDVIYYYVPIQNGKLMKKFSDKVLRDMKVGAVLIPHGWRPEFPTGCFEPIRIKSGPCTPYIKIKQEV